MAYLPDTGCFIPSLPMNV